MRLNTDNTTNAAIAVMVAIELLEKLTKHPIPPDAKATINEVLLGIGLWFTGKPSPTTHRILNHLGINDAPTPNNPAFYPASDRAPNVGADDPQYRDNRDVGLAPPPPIDPAARTAAYWRDRPPAPVVGSPTIEGARMSGVEYSAWSQSGDDEPKSEAW